MKIVIDISDPEKAVKLLKALANVNRIKILHLARDGDLCAYDMAKELRLSRAAITKFLRQLEDVGVIMKTPVRGLRYIPRERISLIIPVIDDV